MIDTVLLCMAWATFGYALAIIHLDRETRYRHTTSGWPPTRSNAVSLKHRADRFPCFHCKRFRRNERFLICWCDHDRREFPDLCDEYDPKHSHQTIDFVSSLVYQKT